MDSSTVMASWTAMPLHRILPFRAHHQSKSHQNSKPARLPSLTPVSTNCSLEALLGYISRQALAFGLPTSYYVLIFSLSALAHDHHQTHARLTQGIWYLRHPLLVSRFPWRTHWILQRCLHHCQSSYLM